MYCSNGQVEIDNNIAENALRRVAVDWPADLLPWKVDLSSQ